MAFQDACARLLLPHLCSPSSVFLDVGAHIGSVTADVRRHHRSIRVIAVEADPEKASALARKFKNIDVYSCAIGDTDGEVNFFVDEVRPGYSSLARNAEAGVREIAVPMKRLDTIIPKSANVEVLKIDVEGAERGALSAEPRIWSLVVGPLFFFESGPRGGEKMGFTIEALFNWFAAREYQVLVPNRVAHNGPGLALDEFIESHYFDCFRFAVCLCSVEPSIYAASNVASERVRFALAVVRIRAGFARSYRIRTRDAE